MGVLYSLSIKNIFYDKMDLRLFYFRVTILFITAIKKAILRDNPLKILQIPYTRSKSKQTTLVEGKTILPTVVNDN